MADRIKELQQYVTENFHMEDSGERQDWTTGAVRDKREGKGRYDLISPFALARLARTLEEGAKKYADRNWEKGIPQERFLDSALRHLIQYMAGDTGEDHLSQAFWNIHCLLHFDSLEKLK